MRALAYMYIPARAVTLNADLCNSRFMQQIAYADHAPFSDTEYA